MDNASSHTAEITALEVAVLGFSTIKHPPYSPDLAPFDFAIFPTVKAQLKGIRFDSLQELRSETTRITQQFDGQWYRDVFRQWVDRHRKCIQHQGAYFEKEWCFIRNASIFRRQWRRVNVCFRAPVRRYLVDYNWHSSSVNWYIFMNISAFVKDMFRLMLYVFLWQ